MIHNLTHLHMKRINDREELNLMAVPPDVEEVCVITVRGGGSTARFIIEKTHYGVMQRFFAGGEGKECSIMPRRLDEPETDQAG